MVMKNVILPFLVLIVFIPAVFSVLWNNPTVKQAFTDIGNMMNGSESIKQNFDNSGALMQLVSSKVDPNYQAFADIGSQIQIQGSNVYDTPIWIPLEPKPTTCFKQQNSVSDKSQFLDDSNVYNYYPQVQVT
jgi:hypothetical protein